MNLNKYFSIGDRVEYVSPDEPEYDGLTGTIEEVDMTSSTGEEFAYVIFDNEIEDTVPLSKLKPIMKGINEMKKVNEMKKIDESSSMDPQYVIDWIAEEIGDCEWCSDYTYDDYEPILEIETSDGDRFEIIVKPMEGGGKEDVMLESEGGVPTNVKVDLVELIEQFAEEMANKAKGDRTAGMAAKIAYGKLMDLISSL